SHSAAPVLLLPGSVSAPDQDSPVSTASKQPRYGTLRQHPLHRGTPKLGAAWGRIGLSPAQSGSAQRRTHPPRITLILQLGAPPPVWQSPRLAAPGQGAAHPRCVLSGTQHVLHNDSRVHAIRGKAERGLPSVDRDVERGCRFVPPQQLRSLWL